MNRKCFVIMPFVPELHYFYLYLKHHIESQHRVLCERADDQVLTKPILDKIVEYIRNADVVIADCSGRNPNVFYELGMAHAQGKKVILITHDPISEAPSDIRHYEFILYEINKHSEFLERMDNALRNVFNDVYEALYSRAEQVFQQFKVDTGASVSIASKSEFIKRAMSGEATQGIPPLEDEFGIAAFVLPRVIVNSYDVTVMGHITDWLARQQVSL